MNKMYKALATASIIALAAIPITASAQDVTPPTKHNIVNQVKSIPATLGKITNIVNDDSGKSIRVTGRGLAVTDQSDIILSITKDTKIIDSKGKRVSLQSIIDENKVVKAFYGPNITRSLPAIGTALTLVVQDQSFLAIDGKVSEVLKYGIVVKGKDLYSAQEDTVVLRFAPKAKILDQNGQEIAANAIQPGMGIKAFYGPEATMSIPPQSSTNYVLVNSVIDEKGNEEVPGTDGIITNATDDRITVIGNPTEKGGVDYVILTVDKDTQIVDQEGQPLTAAALKPDVRVEAYYGEVMTMIYPAQTHADKIVVHATETNKVEGTIVASERASKDQVYVDVGSDKSTDNDVILNITDKTKVIYGLAGQSELAAGTKIVAYHSSVMTASLPGITNAEIVIVSADNSAVAPK
jgi:hypothetical protein